MTVSATYSPPQYVGNGVTTAFGFSFQFFAPSDLTVNLFDTVANANVSPQPVLNGGGTYDYTVTGAQDINTGEYLAGATITFNTAPLGNHRVTITRQVARVQPNVFTNNAPFPAKTNEGSLDRATLILQELDTARSTLDLKIPSSDAAGLVVTARAAALRAGNFLAWDVSGNLIDAAAPITGTVVSGAMAPVVTAGTLSAARQALAGNKTLDDIATAAWAQGDLLYYNGTDLVRLPAGTVGQLLATLGGSANPAWLTQPVTRPQGRLTLTTGTPVMVSDVTAAGTIFYDPFDFGSFCPVWDGSKWLYFNFAELSLILDATGVLSANNYDVFAYNNSGALAIGFGPSWSTGGGSSTARGTGAGSTAIQRQNGLWVNTNAIVLRNNSVNTASIPASQATYLGTFRATANGQTAMQFKPAAAAGGAANVLGLFNAYNRVPVASINRDSNSANTNSSTTPRSLNNSTSNRISIMDGLGEIYVKTSVLVQIATNGGAASGYQVGVLLNATSGTPGVFENFTQGSGTVNIVCPSREGFPPSLGFNFYQWMEAAANTNAVTIITPSTQAEVEI